MIIESDIWRDKKKIVEVGNCAVYSTYVSCFLHTIFIMVVKYRCLNFSLLVLFYSPRSYVSIMIYVLIPHIFHMKPDSYLCESDNFNDPNVKSGFINYYWDKYRKIPLSISISRVYIIYMYKYGSEQFDHMRFFKLKIANLNIL